MQQILHPAQRTHFCVLNKPKKQENNISEANKWEFFNSFLFGPSGLEAKQSQFHCPEGVNFIRVWGFLFQPIYVEKYKPWAPLNHRVLI